jgi:hypothetical protein
MSSDYYKVDMLTLDTFQNSPHVSSFGYFDVNMQLLPKVNSTDHLLKWYFRFFNQFSFISQLIGTILTYLVILYQFETSEKKAW